MITFSKLGRYGLTGNQLFQYAMLVGVSERNGYEVAIPSGSDLVKFRHTAKFLDHPCTLPVYRQQQMQYDPEVFNQPDRMDFFGSFQSYKYFEHAEQHVHEELQFCHELENRAFHLMPKGEAIVALHVRRGDGLLQLNSFLVLTEGYYGRAMEHEVLPKDKQFLVFSDDLEWCKEKLPLLTKARMIFVEESPLQELALMTLCDAHIISASTFGWWGAWLCRSQSNPVVAPSDWFVPNEDRSFQMDDLIPSRWSRLEVANDFLKEVTSDSVN